jgi:hypothetical protein
MKFELGADEILRRFASLETETEEEIRSER